MCRPIAGIWANPYPFLPHRLYHHPGLSEWLAFARAPCRGQNLRLQRRLQPGECGRRLVPPHQRRPQPRRQCAHYPAGNRRQLPEPFHVHSPYGRRAPDRPGGRSRDFGAIGHSGVCGPQSLRGLAVPSAFPRAGATRLRPVFCKKTDCDLLPFVSAGIIETCAPPYPRI